MRAKRAPQVVRLIQAVGLALTACAFVPPLALASGPFRIEPVFFELAYDPRAYVAGERFATDGRSLAQVATYLHMAGAFGPAQRQLFEAYLQERETQTSTPGYNGWREALTPLSANTDYYSTWKLLTITTDENGRTSTSQVYFQNCLDDAFDTATATLQDRLARYGRASPMLKRWLDAQLQVFAHCSGDTFRPPAEPDPGWEPLERQDRAYQIAAAYFYDMQYAEAARRFEAIGADTTSPWSELGRYLVGRSLLRQALVANVDRERNLAAAGTVFEVLGQDDDYVQRFPSVRGQQSYIDLKQNTPGFLQRTATLLTEDAAQLSSSELADFLFLWQQGNHEAVADGSLAHWLSLANDPSPAATRDIADAWRRYRTQPWLYLVLSRSYREGDVAIVDELGQETAILDARDPASATVLAEAARFLQQHGRLEQAGTLVRRALADAQAVLTATQRNRLQYMFAQLSTDWRDFAARAQLDVVALTYDTNQFIDVTPAQLVEETHGSPLFPRDAAELINAWYTPVMMLDVIEDGRSSGYLVGRMAIAAWVKALMLDDAASAQALARILADYYPARRAALERYLTGTNADFEAAALIFELPGYSPYLHTGIGRKQAGVSESFVPDHVAGGLRRENWWCTTVYDYDDPRAQQDYRQQWLDRAGTTLEQPLFSTFSTDEKAAIAEMHPRLQQSVAAAFGPVIVDYARNNPDDPRVPRLLHRVVFATRNACSGGPGEVSRAAFELLHRNYPDSTWAAQTPYWYN